MASRKQKLGIGCLGSILVLGAALQLTPPGRTLRDLIRNGSLQAAIKEPEKRTYSGDNEANLKALYTALMLYHDSEGQFPQASGWMDAIQNRLNTTDMKAGEGEKKLHNPAYSGANEFGYAINEAASGKFKDDLKDKSTPLIFESKSTEKNAHSDPKNGLRSPGAKAITVDGKVVSL